MNLASMYSSSEGRPTSSPPYSPISEPLQLRALSNSPPEEGRGQSAVPQQGEPTGRPGAPRANTYTMAHNEHARPFVACALRPHPVLPRGCHRPVPLLGNHLTELPRNGRPTVTGVRRPCLLPAPETCDGSRFDLTWTITCTEVFLWGLSSYGSGKVRWPSPPGKTRWLPVPPL